MASCLVSCLVSCHELINVAATHDDGRKSNTFVTHLLNINVRLVCLHKFSLRNVLSITYYRFIKLECSCTLIFWRIRIIIRAGVL